MLNPTRMIRGEMIPVRLEIRAADRGVHRRRRVAVRHVEHVDLRHDLASPAELERAREAQVELP